MVNNFNWSLDSDVIYHHGILNQKWGKRNGPPYPLGGGDYSKAEKQAIYKERKLFKNSIYNKKYFDKVLNKKETELSTLSYDKNRIKNSDFYYATFTKNDKHLYNALFNKKVKDIDGKSHYKWKINTKLKHTIKVASEDSASKVFKDLYENDRDFYNFITDPNRMQKGFVDSKYIYKGYRESRDVLDKIKQHKSISENELDRVYRMFNYVLPNDGAGDSRMAKDVKTQRDKFFNKLSKNGYGAVLDTNDAIYGSFKANAPVIVFDMKNIYTDKILKTKLSDKIISEFKLLQIKTIGG